MTHISILRGINVSGKNIIKMDVLKKLFENLGFENVKTYVQSGNVVFNSKITDTKAIESLISNQIETELGLKVPVIVLSKEELKTCIDQNPFSTNKDEKFLHFTFLAEKPKEFNLNNILEKKTDKELIHISDRVIYLYCPDGYGNTKLSNTFLESKLKVTATTRNWKTTHELLAMANNL